MAAILIVDDDSAIVSALKLLLKPQGHSVETAQSPEQALAVAKQKSLDIALLDMNYRSDTTSGQEGLDLINKFRFLFPETAIIAMTGWSSVDIAVQCLQAGAADFIEKPWDNKRLLSIIRTQQTLCEKSRTQARLQSENRMLKEALCQQSPQPLVAESDAMKALLQTLQKVAASDLNILLTGENGTGKSLLARYIHGQSTRCEAPLVTVNTGAIHQSLFESEMFGHVKGAFTDARENRVGRFELAHSGSLFLDEIGNLPLSQQVKLLRVLEEKCFEKVGCSATLSADVRIISATNADIHRMVAQGHFRQDLLYRLNSVEIHVPPLRERVSDILPLAQQMLENAAARQNKKALPLTETARQALLTYHWPGNIRELQHVIERSVVLCTTDTLTESDLALRSIAAKQQHSRQLPEAFLSGDLDAIERELIELRIQIHSGHMSNAARSLGLSRSAFYRRLEKLAIPVDRPSK